MSGLDSQTVDIKFTEGLDTHTQRKLVVPGKWDTLINLSLSEDGSLKRRDGFEALIDGQAGNGLATHDNQLLIVNGPSVSTVSRASTPDTAISASGKLGFVGVDKAEVRRQGGVQEQQDCAYGDGLICYVWRQSSFAGATQQSVRCSIIDAVTGAPLLDDSALNSTTGAGRAITPRVVFADGSFFIFYIVGSGAGTALTCNVIATSAPTTVGAAVALVTSANLIRGNIDAVQFPSDAQVSVLYGWNDGTDSARAIQVEQALTVPSISAGPIQVFSEATVPFAQITAFALATYSTDTDLGCFVTSQTIGLVGAVVDDSFAVAVSEVVLSATVGVTNSPCHLTAVRDGTALRVFRDFESEWGTNALNNIIAQVVSITMATTKGPTALIPEFTYGGAGNPRGPQGPFIYGKAFSTGGRFFLPVAVLEDWAGTVAGATTSNLQNTFFLLDAGAVTGSLGTGVVVAKALYGSLGIPAVAGAAPAVGTPSAAPSTSSGVYILPATERTQLNLFDGGLYSETGLVSLSFEPNYSLPPLRLQIEAATFFEGGSLSKYDGLRVTEVGFPLHPEGILAAAVAGGTCTDGVHQVTVTYDSVDASGDVERSAPAPAVSVTCGGGNNTVRLDVPTLALSQKPGITISVWMTTAGGVTFNLASRLTANSTAAPFVTIDISDSDANLAGNQLLYNQLNQAGTTLANVAPGPVHGIGESQGRLWFFKSDEPGRFGYSQEALPNTALQFSPDLGGSLPVESGRGVRVAELDEKTILFCERKLYVVYGTGPTPSGGFNNFSEPQEIPSDVGCSEARSVLSMPFGLMFKSPKGFYILGRDLSVRYVGEGVSRFDAYDVTSAVMLEDRQECRFTSSNAAAPTLVYSYLVGQWSVFYLGNLLHPGEAIDAVWWPTTGRYVHLQPSDATYPGLMSDTPGLYIDGEGTSGEAGFAIVARTGFLHLGKLGGFQRVRELYLTASADAAPTTSLVISVDFDDLYGSAATGSYTVTVPLSGLGLTNGTAPAADLRHTLARQKCKSVAFTFSEGSANTALLPLTGIQALALEVGIKRGVNKLPATQTVG